ncbi:MAG: hypothetical protein ABWY93_21260 [Mycobacterium sp.]
MNSTAAAVGRRRLTQRKAALWLAIGFLAVPTVPLIFDVLLPERDWDTAEAVDKVDLVSEDGHRIVVVPPDGWEIHDLGDVAVMRTDGVEVTVSIYDTFDRDPDQVAQRLMRANRVQGINSALDGGHVATADGSLSGDSCVVVTEESTGTCAYLVGDDVMVSVLAVADPDRSAPAIADVVAPITKGQS